MAEGEDRDLIASAAAGDEAAFGRIIADHHEDMRRVCTYITRDEQIAQEATNAAWAIAWKKIGDVRDPGSLRPWLVSVAVNEAKRYLKKSKRRAEVEIRTDQPDERGTIDPETGIDILDLRAAMARLAPDDRALLAMRYGAGFTAVELGEASGRSAGATRQRLKRLLDRLREDLADG